MPKRIQRLRVKGWRKPYFSKYVGRGSRWGNPYRIGDQDPILVDHTMDRGDVVRMFEWYAAQQIQRNPIWLEPLRGRDLCCWCPPDQPCHADVLLRMANEEK